MSRTLALTCVLLLIAIAGWVWLSTGEPSAPPRSPNPATPTVDHGNPAEPAAAPRTTTATKAIEREAVASDPDTANEAPAIPDDAKWIELMIVDGESNAPIAGADVWWTNDLCLPLQAKLPLREQRELSQEAVARRFGWHARSDADGRVRVTPDESAAWVTARDASRYGQGFFSARSETPAYDNTLDLFVDRSLEVHVTDATGNDAEGVPVTMLWHDPDGIQPQAFAGGETLITDHNGTVSFPHVQRQARWAWGPRRGTLVTAMAIAVTTPGIEIAPVIVERSALPSEPIELRLPMTGHLTLRATFEGQPIPGLHDLSIHTDRPGNQRGQIRYWSRPIDDDGWARFRHVPLGQTFHAGDHSWSFEVLGPTALGQDVQLTFEVSGRVQALSGRLLAADGEPLAEQQVSAEFDFGVTGGGASVTTDLDGRFLWLIAQDREGQTAELKELTFHQRPSGSPPRRVGVSPRALSIGRNELGDLRIVADALVVGGRFAFDRGGRRTVLMQVERFEVRPGSDGRWQQVDGLQQAQHEDHSFEIRGEGEQGRYRLVFLAYNHLPVAPVDFVLGQTDLEIPIACGATLDASCVLPDGIETHELQFTLVPQDPELAAAEDSAMSNARLQGRPIDERGHRARYDWGALAEGNYTLRIAATPNGGAIAEIADVVVPPPPTGDPRLIDIDLRPIVQVVRITLRDPDHGPGRPQPPIIVFPLPQPDNRDWTGIQPGGDAGSLTIPMPQGPVDMLIARSGFRPVTVHGVVEGEVEVEFERATTLLQLQFTGIGELPADVSLSVGITRPAGESPDRRRFRTSTQSGPLSSLLGTVRQDRTIENGSATITVDEGVQTLRVVLIVGRRSATLEQVTPREVATGAPVTVQLSADEIRRVADELRRAKQE